jgi:hypothetical protein
MTKNPLVPTTIVNKNGVTTTVHKRAEANGNASAMIPSPAALPLKDDELSKAEACVGAALITVQGYEDFHHDIGDFRVLERRLARWEPSVIRAYATMLDNHPNHGYDELVASVLYNDHDPDEASYLLITAQEDKRPDSDWSGFEGGTFTYGIAKSIYWGIASLSEEYGFDLPELPFEAEDQKPVEIFQALAIVTYAVYHSNTQKGLVSVTTEDGEGMMLNNNELIDLIIKRPEDAQRISSIVVDRENPDAALIEEMLDTEVPALRDGII